MAGLINLSIRLDKLSKEKFIKGKTTIIEGKEVTPIYYNITVEINDDTKYANNVTSWDAQTKEERVVKKTRNYIANGGVIWTDGVMKIVDKNKRN